MSDDPWWPDGTDDPAFQTQRQAYGVITGGDYVRARPGYTPAAYLNTAAGYVTTPDTSDMDISTGRFRLMVSARFDTLGTGFPSTASKQDPAGNREYLLYSYAPSNILALSVGYAPNVSIDYAIYQSPVPLSTVLTFGFEVQNGSTAAILIKAWMGGVN